MANATNLLLIRHAETSMLTGKRIHGHLDASLSEAGLRDNRKTAEYPRGQSFDAPYAISLGRAMRTSKVVENDRPVDNLRHFRISFQWQQLAGNPAG